MRTPVRILTRTRRHSPAAVLAAGMFGMAVALWGQAPVLVTNRDAAILSWEQSDPLYILTESPTVDGLYTPSLEPIIFGGNQVAVVTSEPPTRFFQLAQGGQLLEDFSSGENHGWTITYINEADEGKFQANCLNGALRIQQDVGEASGPVAMQPPRWLSGDWPHCADVVMSVDILDWDENALAMVGFGARFVSNPGEVSNGNGYWPRITLTHADGSSPRFGCPRLTDLVFTSVAEGQNVQLGSKRSVRLVYSLAAGTHTAAVIDLANERTIVTWGPAFDHVYEEGLFSLWIGGGETTAPDITIDNVVMTWTSP